VDPARWRRLEGLFDAALERPVSERARFLRAACPDDPRLAEEVAALLEHALPTGALERAVGAAASAVVCAADERDERDERIEAEPIGPYTLLRKLGEGGMGSVWLAEQTAPLRRRVAIKRLRRGFTDPAARRRFEAEAQALARMSHPDIARIYDAGTSPDGQPYLVMELVEGEPITRYCDRRRLGVGPRLELMQAVCRAVQHAHDRGVLHRDLKPSNLLVAEEQGRALPKIIDFGVAKALGDPLTAEPPESGPFLLGTPAYMSPETLRAPGAVSPPDARSDVYALGVVLYELLVGVHPFSATDPLGIAQEAVQQGIPPPSDHYGRLDAGQQSRVSRDRSTDRTALRRQLRTGLDGIVLRATARDPAARYATAGELAADLGRALRGESPLPTAAGRRARRASRASRQWRAAALGLAALPLLFLGGPSPPEPGPGPPPAAATIRSIAVLPLRDLSPGRRQDYLSEGLTEALIVDLAKIRSLRVISRTSVLRFAGGAVPSREIARQLAVDATVEGTVAVVGERVRVTAQLIEGASGLLLWSQSYEREVGDALALERRVARAVVEEIRLTLSPEEERQLDPAPAVAPEVYDLYLRARYFANRRTQDGLQRALSSFRRALALDPRHAPSYAGMADCYALLAPYGARAPREVYPLARQAALRALALDDSLGAAHASLGLVHHEYDGDWSAAERQYRRALELAPNDATAHQWYAELLSRAGRHREALDEIDRALALDPLSLIVNTVAGWAALNAGRHDEAIRQLAGTLELDPGFFPAEGHLGVAYLARGDPRTAARHLRRAVALSGENPRYLAELGVAQARSGHRRAAEAALTRLTEIARRAPVHGFHRARLHLALGDRERALAALEDGLRERGVWMLLLKTDSLLAPLRGEPRFEAMLRRLDFPD
jgi:serine/threonine protein kinase/tetratricopeptide (TPR) repeat protein